MIIDENNTRRFRLADGVDTLAIFDTRNGFNIYAVVEYDALMRPCFKVETARSYFNDEIEELR